MSVNQINTVYGSCRCCLTKGFHRDMLKEYYSNGIREVYNDIIIECFNLNLTEKPKLTTLICKACTSRLRDASNFKIMVVNSQQQLLQMPDDDKNTFFIKVPKCDNIDESIEVDETIVKVEDSWQDDHDAETTEECHDDSQTEDEIKGEAELLSRFPAGTLKKLPTRMSSSDTCQYWKHLECLKGKVIKAKMLQRLLTESPENRSNYKKQDKQNLNDSIHEDNSTNENVSFYGSQKRSHVANITTLLQFSNLTAFKTKYKNGFPCFYCNSIFENLDILRVHQIVHDKENLSKFVLKKYRPGRPDCLVVYADIKDLKCTLCDLNINNIPDLKMHLYYQHNKSIDFSVTDRVIPFKMAGNCFNCQICNFDFETFGAIEKHMSVHYRNYICTKCDSGFITKNRLKVHLYSVHTQNKIYNCNICEKEYKTYRKFKIHNDVVHNMVRRNECPKCKARFADYTVKMKHLVEVHGVTPTLYTCKICDKSFTRPFTLSNHIKKYHMEERNVLCQKCTYRCFDNNELKVHMVKQHGEKLFECVVCKKSYACRKSLAKHLVLHNDK